MRAARDQRHVREGLREVAQRFTSEWVDLLGEQTDVVGKAEQPFEQRVGFVEVAGMGEAVEQPERTQQERAFTTVETVVGLVAVDEPVVSEVAPNRVDSR